jgi:hypothetical protein
MIWYASYGSNINESRFLCYINGGTPDGSDKYNKGCTDKSYPTKIKNKVINFELYFAKKSKTWQNGGVAFISTKPNDEIQTFVKMYLITKQQFIEVLQQETNQLVDFDFEEVIQNKFLVFNNKSWYGQIMYLGMEDEHPIFTFTNSNIIEPTKPSVNYLKTIITGMKESYQLNNDEISNYLLSKKGIKDNFDIQSIQRLF